MIFIEEAIKRSRVSLLDVVMVGILSLSLLSKLREIRKTDLFQSQTPRRTSHQGQKETLQK